MPSSFCKGIQLFFHRDLGTSPTLTEDPPSRQCNIMIIYMRKPWSSQPSLNKRLAADNVAFPWPSTQVGYTEPSNSPDKSSVSESVDHGLDHASQFPPDLQTVVDGWHKLPGAVQRAIIDAIQRNL